MGPLSEGQCDGGPEAGGGGGGRCWSSITSPVTLLREGSILSRSWLVRGGRRVGRESMSGGGENCIEAAWSRRAVGGGRGVVFVLGRVRRGDEVAVGAEAPPDGLDGDGSSR